ncbi:transcription repressor OFP1-like [Canna indica]|uniref:Transcription repressor n=1 Tax=Canna indica TaxID=4628 RepID=A0AAQ3Q8E0_9LILI|nr:transcription repressor OFP1-like [Canna indica]
MDNKKNTAGKGGGGGGGGLSRSGLKHLFAQMLLRSSCTNTAVAATVLIRHSSADLPRQDLEYHCKGKYRDAPMVQVSVHCGARNSIRPVEPPPERKKKAQNKIGEVYETGEREGRKCPPASNPKKDYERKSKLISSSSSVDCNKELGLSSSGEEEEECSGTTLFSSKSFSSDSSDFYFKRRTKTRKSRRSRQTTSSGVWSFERMDSTEKRVQHEAETEVGVAIVKNSSNPYMDFRSSMAEMIAERQMSSAREMESLLNSYLSLNSPLHHSVIMEAFVDIWEAILALSPVVGAARCCLPEWRGCSQAVPSLELYRLLTHALAAFTTLSPAALVARCRLPECQGCS